MIYTMQSVTAALRWGKCQFACNISPVLPLPHKKGMHDRSEFHGERVYFPEVRMSVIL